MQAAMKHIPTHHARSFDADAIRQDFPMLTARVRPDKDNLPLVFLDSAASAQKPRAVLDAMQQLYTHNYANIHRGVYYHSMQATEAFEAARTTIQQFINAGSDKEILFVRGATEGINLVAQSYGRTFLKKGDVVLVSEMEHHANIVPWQMLRNQIGITLKVVPIHEDGTLDMEAYQALLAEGDVGLVAITHASNALGTVTDAKQLVALAHKAGAKILLDGCQAIVHRPVDVQALDADFYVFSGHKLYGPTGIGVLYGKQALLDKMPPWQGGGEMIRSVTFEHTEFNDLPHKFEAGTPAIAEAIGLATAINYLSQFAWQDILAHEQALLDYATKQLLTISGLRLIGTAADKTSILSFVMESIHANDIGMVLDKIGIAIRTGHHCAEPLMHRYDVPATARASLGIYSTKADIDALVQGLHKVQSLFG